jgi:hypothetical protein
MTHDERLEYVKRVVSLEGRYWAARAVHKQAVRHLSYAAGTALLTINALIVMDNPRSFAGGFVLGVVIAAAVAAVAIAIEVHRAFVALGVAQDAWHRAMDEINGGAR